ncbi:hypothetical protein [Trinickia sp.]|uniref:hypothetical protein n=1 Tax=Trinickia sp. TaxID=2571163 RepID=UPI003F7EC476
MSNDEQPERKDERKKQSDAGVERMHIERQPVPGHTENIPVDGDMRQAPAASPIDGPVAGPVGDAAPTADPETKPGTPPGTQSERDRLRGES